MSFDDAGPVTCERPLGEDRHFLLICGPFGPFTRRLADNLRRAGARCSRVVLNGGDVYDWGVKHGHAYFGPLRSFRAWLSETIRREGVTDLLLYGDAHPYCREAAEAAAERSLKVHVLEQGYFRPFWITLERDGVNANSSLPRDPDVYRRLASSLKAPEDEWLPPLTPPAAWKLALYHTAILLMTPAFPRFRAPYQYSITHQAIGHTRRYFDQRWFPSRHARALAKALEPRGPLFLGILQRPGDSQLRLHSPFRSTAEFIERTVASFARHAPSSAKLLFKAHPLDHGIERHGRTISQVADASGVADRVFFADFGDLQSMIPGAGGAVTINSTAGLAAVEHGVPTMVMGDAIYDMPGLTHQNGIDTFWTAAEHPDRGLYDAFRKVVIARTQVSGAYAITQGIERAVPEITRRLLFS